MDGMELQLEIYLFTNKMNNLKKFGLIGLISLFGLDCNNPSIPRKINLENKIDTLSVEKQEQKNVIKKDWDYLLKQAELEADTLFMQDMDIIEILSINNVFHVYMYPIPIGKPDSLGNQSYQIILGYSNNGQAGKNLILINDYTGENKSMNHLKLTTIHELLHHFYWSKGRNFSENEINARALVWYRKNFLKNIYENKNKEIDSTKK